MGQAARQPELVSDRVIDFAHAFLKVPDGIFVQEPLRLRDWQQDLIRSIYDRPTRLAIISFGRKNGKTALTAVLILAHLVGPCARRNSQIYSAATSRDQAALVFGFASKMVRMSPKLNKLVRIIDSRKELYCGLTGVSYKALSADATTAYGLSPAFVIHDELGQVKGERSELYEALETGVGAQPSPLSIIISTQAPTDNDLLSRLIDRARTGADPRTVLRINSADESLDPFSEEALRAANPAFGDFLNANEALAMAAEAKAMPSREASYRNLILNQRVQGVSPFCPRGLWDANGAPPQPINGCQVYGGLDLSEVKDLTALVLIGKRDGLWHVHPTFWLPGEGLAEKSRADRVPYDEWAKAGFLRATPTRSIDYEFVAEFLKSQFDKFNIQKIGFDRWNFKHLKPWLLKAGFTEHLITERFIEFGQGFQSMSPALRDLEGELLNHRIAHGNHPVLTMCNANAVVQSDPAGNRKLAKNKSTGRIDGMISLTMAFGVAPMQEPNMGFVRGEAIFL